jgi:hypothetical protein
MKKLLSAILAVAALALSSFATGLVTAEVAVAAPSIVSCSTAHPVKWDRPGGYCEQVRDLKSLASHKSEPKKKPPA